MTTTFPHARAAVLGLLLFAVLVAAAPADAHHRKSRAATKACANADLVPTAGNLAQVRRATLCLLNRERRKRGRRSLRTSRTLQDAAVGYARQMVVREFFAHTSPTGSTLLERIKEAAYLDGARRWLVGENLAWGTGSEATPRRIVRGWMASPGHKRNIIDKRFRHIGIGVVLGAPAEVPGDVPAATYATEFGRRS